MRYPGGKGKCYQHLINLMPRHHTYIESHLGGGAVLRHKLPAKRNIAIELDESVVARWRADAESNVELVQGDALIYLSGYSYTGGELVYCDPPYMRSTRSGGSVYRHEYDEDDHRRLLRVLATLPCMVMISGYTNGLYESMLGDWRTHSFMAKTHTGLREETVWMNFPPPTALHDSRYLGADFRQRQTIKRRGHALKRRVEGLTDTERAALIRWMSEAFTEEFREALCS
ncbi:MULTISPECIES: DNA adenine methylase [Luteibacter]|uniref:DNA adenine methylase n=1 Tax=Luteibacter TaxID=242605 RepID=UPI000560D2E7|nr:MULTISPECIES: DNA adenine methylase [unclassified Luteibacter]